MSPRRDEGRLSGAGSTSYSYDPAGEPTQTVLANGCSESRSYDRSGRVTDIANSCGGSTVSHFGYTLDAVGNPSAIDTLTGTQTLGYDNADRLTAFNGPAGPIAWSYDPVGNRLSETRAAGTTTYSYTSADRLTATSGPGGNFAYSYDANGNQTSDGVRTFSFDLANQLTTATVGGQTTSYSYDGDGNRLTAQGATTTNYQWDPNAGLPLLALERDSSGTTLRRYGYGLDLLSMHTGGNDYYYLHDKLGSIANLTNSSGTLEWSYSYEPYGTTLQTTQHHPTAPANPMQYTGQYHDTATGLYNLRARQYDPTTGRFLTLDPLAHVATLGYLSAYAYADDRPSLLIDPGGMDSDRDGFCWGCLAGALKDAVVNAGKACLFGGGVGSAGAAVQWIGSGIVRYAGGVGFVAGCVGGIIQGGANQVNSYLGQGAINQPAGIAKTLYTEGSALQRFSHAYANALFDALEAALTSR